MLGEGERRAVGHAWRGATGIMYGGTHCTELCHGTCRGTWNYLKSLEVVRAQRAPLLFRKERPVEIPDQKIFLVF